MKVLIVDNDAHWQKLLGDIIQTLEPKDITIAHSWLHLKQHLAASPDLILSEIEFGGINVLHYFREQSKSCPIIFITHQSDPLLLSAIKDIPLATFIVKPFHPFTLISNVQLLTKVGNTRSTSDIAMAGIRVRGKHRQRILLPYHDIVYIKAEGNYVKIYANEQFYTLKRSLKNMLSTLPDSFVQVHKSNAINIACMIQAKLVQNELILPEATIKVGRFYRKGLLSKIK